jgi:hypothetical protein
MKSETPRFGGVLTDSCHLSLVFVVTQAAEADRREFGVVAAKGVVFTEGTGWEQIAFESGTEVIAEFGGSFAAIPEEQTDGKKEDEG